MITNKKIFNFIIASYIMFTKLCSNMVWVFDVKMIYKYIQKGLIIFVAYLPLAPNFADVSNSILDLFGVLSVERHPPETIPSHMTCLWGGGRVEHLNNMNYSATRLLVN